MRLFRLECHLSEGAINPRGTEFDKRESSNFGCRVTTSDEKPLGIGGCGAEIHKLLQVVQ